jgi:deferrochelatase/peroxidase EfeB
MCDFHEIQGDVIPGFRRGSDETFHQAFVLLRIADVDAARGALAALEERITWSDELHQRPRDDRRRVDGRVDVNVALTWDGLTRLKSDLIAPDAAFEAGLAARSQPERLLGPPDEWMVGRPDQRIDVVLNVGSTSPLDLDNLPSPVGAGFVEITQPDGSRYSGGMLPGGIEHFGFRDGLSQPQVTCDQECDRPFGDGRGAAADAPARGRSGPYRAVGRATYATESEVATLYGSAADNEERGPQPDGGPPIAASKPNLPARQFVVMDEGFWRNGSFMVWLRLRQDVGVFQRECDRIATRLADEWRRRVSPEDAAALLVGRRRDGTSLALCGLHDVNEFSYLQRSPFDADRYGLRCPLGAHTRKMNPRTVGDSKHLILRRGIPYGPTAPPEGDDGADRGLYFVAYQASIENQYEVLQGTWANSAIEPERNGSADAMASAASWVGTSIEIPNPNGRGSIGIGVRNRWVRPTGGLYLFVPSRTALHELARV